MLGLTRDEIINAVSLAWVDGQSLRTYRHAPNTGSRKSWAAGDATSRAVRLALIAKTGEMGYPSVLTAKTWGFYDVLFKGNAFKFQRPYGSYVMENVLFKISFPAEFHAQTAVECAMTLHAELAQAGQDAPTDIKKITIRTHEAVHPHHRQEGAARQPGRPRPLHPVHGRRAAPLRPAHRRRLRGRRRARTRASTRCATKIVCVEDQQFTQGLPRPRQALDRQRPHGRVQGRQEAQGDRGRVPDRPQAPAQGRHAGAGREVPDQPRAPLPREAAQAILDLCLDAKRARGHAGATSSST